MYDFSQVKTDKESISQCNAFLKYVFPKADKFSEAYIKWQYADNPLGKIIGFNAFKGDELAAHYVTMPVIANVFGKETKGLLSLNTATHPDHQKQKVFTTLAEMTYKYAADNGYEFVVGVGNANSIHGLINNLAFQYIALLEVKIYIGGIKTENENKQFCFERIWTNELLQWRIKSPWRSYEIKDNNVYTPTGKFGIKAIMGSFDSYQLNNIPGSNIFSINPMKLYIGINSSIKWKRLKYFDVPDRLKPAPLHLVFKDITGNNLKLDTKSVKFQLIDFDGY